MVTTALVIPVVLVIGTLRFTHVPLWASMFILAVVVWTPLFVVARINDPWYPLINLIGISFGVLVGVVVITPGLYAIRRGWNRFVVRLTIVVASRWHRKMVASLGGVPTPSTATPPVVAVVEPAVNVDVPPMQHRPIRRAPSPLIRERRAIQSTDNEWQALGDRLRESLRRAPVPPVVALLCGWTLVWIALWLAAIGAFIGFLVGFGGGTGIGVIVVPAGWTSLGLVSAIVGAAIGAAVFFLAIYIFDAVAGWMAFVISLITGTIISGVITAIALACEPWTMTMRGYRRMSDRESGRLQPVIDEVCHAMQITDPPPFLVHDVLIPGAWTHPRHIVLTKRSLDLDHRELAALIAHELEHYRSGDTVYGLFVWACAFPVAVLGNLQSLAWNKVGPLVGLISGIIFWPALLMLRFMIGPLTARWSREAEYRADAAAADAGYGSSLIKLLEAIKVFEPARSGWSAVTTAQHPPTELRIEALQRRLRTVEDESVFATLTPEPV